MAEFPATYDQRYMEFSRVWLDGSNEAINIPLAKQVKFTDPFSGQTYVALHYDCTKADEAADVGCSATVHAATGAASVEAGVGARMLLHLADMEAVRQKAVIRQGIDRELAKRLVKEVKDKKFKVQVTVQGDELRVSGKKRDDLQAVIQHVKGMTVEQPLQYVNFRD